jgi:hypothetical protein
VSTCERSRYGNGLSLVTALQLVSGFYLVERQEELTLLGMVDVVATTVLGKISSTGILLA